MNRQFKVILSSISPKMTTYLMYYYNFKRRLDLKNLRDINDKLQYLKLKTYYNNPVITQCVDKYRVREYIENSGWGYLLPRLLGGPFENAKDMEKVWEDLPKSFVVKCNHGCGYNILVRDKNQINLEEVIVKLNWWLHEDYWKFYCEPQYKNVRKAILIEEYLADDIETYKFYCFHGEPRVMYLSSNGENGEKDLYLDFYDMDMNWLDITLYPHRHSQEKAHKPENYEKMLKIARELSGPFPFVRIDLYNVEGKIYFSEFTFIPTGGNMKLTPESTLVEWGKLLKL